MKGTCPSAAIRPICLSDHLPGLLLPGLRPVISLLNDTPASIVYVTHNADELPEMTNRIQTLKSSGSLEKSSVQALSNIGQTNPVRIN